MLVGIPQVIAHFVNDPLDLTGIVRLTIMLDTCEKFVPFATDTIFSPQNDSYLNTKAHLENWILNRQNRLAVLKLTCIDV